MRIMIVGAALGLTACVSVGNEFSDQNVGRLAPGMTSAEVIQLLGKPSATSVNYSAGVTAMTWMHARGNAFGQGSAKSVVLLFDKDNRLIQVNRSDSQVN